MFHFGIHKSIFVGRSVNVRGIFSIRAASDGDINGIVFAITELSIRHYDLPADGLRQNGFHNHVTNPFASPLQIINVGCIEVP